MLFPKDTLVEIHKAHTRARWWRTLGLCIILTPFVVLVISKFIHLNDYFLFAIMPLPAFAISALRVANQIKRQFGNSHCFICGKKWTLTDIKIIIASNCCPFCEKKVTETEKHNQ